MPRDNPHILYEIVTTLENKNIPLESLIRRCIVEPDLSNSQLTMKFLAELPRLLQWLMYHEQTRDVVKNWVKQQYLQTLTSQLCTLTRPESGLHFNASTITPEKMKECTVEKIAGEIQTKAPDVWEVVGQLLQADPMIIHRQEKEREEREKKRKLKNTSTSSNNGGGEAVQAEKEQAEEREAEEHDNQLRLEIQRCSLLQIVSHGIIASE